MTSTTGKLRVGLLVDSYALPLWIADIIDQIQSSAFAQVVLVVVNEANPVPAPRTLTEKVRRYARGFVYRQYENWDKRRYTIPRDPFSTVDTARQLADVAVVKVTPRMTRFSDYFDDGAVDSILAYQLDVAIRFGFRILKGRSLQIARHGVWSYHHGDNTVNRGGPAGFWEVAEQHPVTGAILQILTEELDNGRAIARTWAATHPTSLKMNRVQYYRLATSMVIRKLRDLQHRGPAALEDPLGSLYKPYTQRLYRRPSNSAAARALVGIGTRLVSRKIRQHTTREQWQLAYKMKPQGQGSPDVPDPSFYNYSALVPPLDRFWADPFPVHSDGVYHVFFEEFIYARRRGHISVQEFGPKGPIGEPRPVLAPEYHLSFPNVLSIGGEIYMLPESLEARRIELFGCVRYPDQWESAEVLLDGIPAVDPVIAEWNGRWWMFLTTDGGTGTSWDELYIYHAESPFGPWRPHALNPVKTDVRSSRSAGRIFHLAGRTYRPAQNGSPTYGSSITVNEIVRLDEENFEERLTATIAPDWSSGLTGVHTMNAAGQLSAIDVRKRLPRWR